MPVTYLFQPDTVVYCILLDSLGLNLGHSGRWGQYCQQDIEPLEHGSHRYRNLNTEGTWKENEHLMNLLDELYLRAGHILCSKGSEATGLKAFYELIAYKVKCYMYVFA